jgi:hypothetical protein
MTTETLIEKVRNELGSLDAQSEQAVAMAMKILQSAEAAPIPQASEEKFSSHNITLEEYKALPREEKRRYHDEAEKSNWRWVESQLTRLNAKWLMVVDGKVVKHGSTLKNFPARQELIELCNRTGKYPFAFFSPSMFAIEELSTPWHTTKDIRDAYPAVSIRVSGNNNRVETEADFDTGSADCYASLRLLTQSGVVKIEPEDIERSSQHLGRLFFYYTIPVWIELADSNGKKNECQTAIACVDDWREGPFTMINPNRTFLLGRSVLLELQPRLVLDFAVRRTEVQYAKATS